ncbi:MAG TPA: nodulation protein NfeD [Methanomicrobia archaeon]|nr:nodulation protein NfeD [Methanomicrobia archaeon]
MVWGVNVRNTVLFACISLLVIGMALCGFGQSQPDAPVYVLELDGEINKATEEIIVNAIERANDEGAYAFVLALNTPGGRTDAMFNIVEAMQQTSIPVLYFVHPKGAISASAGTYLAMASNMIGMAPLTTIGACEPILGYDPTTGDVIEAPQKIREYYTAVMRSYAEDHGRDPEVAARFVSENLSLTPDEALDLGMADVKADDIATFLDAVDGLEIKGTVNGEKVVLDTAGRETVSITLSLKDRILMAISDPNIAYLLTTIGMLGIVFGFLTPGIGIPEVVGVLFLGLAVIANGYVGFEYGGILLIVLGFIFFIAEALTSTFGLYTAAGTISFVVGSLLLFSGTPGGEGRFFNEESVRMFWLSIGVMTVLIVGFLVFGLQAALRLRRTAPTTGNEQMLQEEATVIDDLDPAGTVRIHGELWNARANERVPAGERVRVVAVDGLTLIVERNEVKGGENTYG